MARPYYTVRWSESRGFTNALHTMVDDELLDKDLLIGELLRWMSEQDVEDFCTRSLLLRDEDNQPVIRREADEEDFEDCEEDF